jgi:serine protease Do
MNGEPLDSARELRNRVAIMRPGTKVRLKILRDGGKKSLTVVLDKRPSEQVSRSTPGGTLRSLGFSVTNLTNELAQQHGFTNESGVIVTQVDSRSRAAQAGIRPGMLIKEVNRQQVSNVKEFNKAVNQSASKGRVLLLVDNGRLSRFVMIEVPEQK